MTDAADAQAHACPRCTGALRPAAPSFDIPDLPGHCSVCREPVLVPEYIRDDVPFCCLKCGSLIALDGRPDGTLEEGSTESLASILPAPEPVVLTPRPLSYVAPAQGSEPPPGMRARPREPEPEPAPVPPPPATPPAPATPPLSEENLFPASVPDTLPPVPELERTSPPEPGALPGQPRSRAPVLIAFVLVTAAAGALFIAGVPQALMDALKGPAPEPAPPVMTRVTPPPAPEPAAAVPDAGEALAAAPDAGAMAEAPPIEAPPQVPTQVFGSTRPWAALYAPSEPAAQPAAEKPHPAAGRERASASAEPAPALRSPKAPSPAALAQAARLRKAGAIQLQRGQLPAALTSLRRAAALEPTNPEAFKQLGAVHTALGNSTDAVKAYNRYLSLAPHAKDAAEVKALIQQLK